MELVVAIVATVVVCYLIMGFAVAALDGRLSRRNSGRRLGQTGLVMVTWPLSVMFWSGTL